VKKRRTQLHRNTWDIKALEVGTEKQKKKKKKYINETIGKRNIELGRDTWGIEKESAHDYPSENENILQLEVNGGGKTCKIFLGNSTNKPSSQK
jgi:hypothetical protein